MAKIIIMKILFILISLYCLSSCNSGLVKGDVHEEDVKANDWNRKDLVITVQNSLTELGYKTGDINGIENTETLQAVKQYRIDQDLKINTVIDGNLERHIDDFIWKTRNEKSVDPRTVAKVIVQNRHEEECIRLLGQNYSDIPFPINRSSNAEVYIYRLHNSSGKQPDYPDSAIFINKEHTVDLKHNEYIKLELKPGKYIFSEKETKPLKSKRSSEYSLIVENGETYFLHLSVGKITTPNAVETSPPFYIGYGLLDVLVGELVWDIQNSNKYGNTYHFSNFIPFEMHIGKCHINLLNNI